MLQLARRLKRPLAQSNSLTSTWDVGACQNKINNINNFLNTIFGTTKKRIGEHEKKEVFFQIWHCKETFLLNLVPRDGYRFRSMQRGNC